MISTTICGGLGNQLFMYATARALSLKKKTDLFLNINTGFINDIEYKRIYELDNFNIKFKKNRLLTFDYPLGTFIQKVSKRLGVNLLCPWYKYYNDPTQNKDFDPILYNLKTDNLYIDGYWQSEKYFAEFEKEIRQDLQMNFEKSNLLIKEEKEIFDNPGSETPICLGVRLYQECKHALSFEITQVDYYLKAMDYICKLVENPVFYVFTQAKEWVSENIESCGKYKIKYVSEKPNSTIEDLYLMTKFRFHIISNSSYYWWGAWLAKGEMVISNNNFINKATNCKEWIVID